LTATEAEPTQIRREYEGNRIGIWIFLTIFEGDTLVMQCVGDNTNSGQKSTLYEFSNLICNCLYRHRNDISIDAEESLS